MKKQAILLMFFLSSFCVFSQKTIENSFKIQNNNSTLSNQFIEKSFLKAAFEPYRDKDKSVILKFSNGFEVELLSATALVSKGLLPDTTNYTVKEFASNPNTFTMLDSGQIMVPAPASQNAKYKSTNK